MAKLSSFGFNLHEFFTSSGSEASGASSIHSPACLTAPGQGVEALLPPRHSAPPGTTAGRQGGLEVIEAVPQLGRQMNDLGGNPWPSPSSPMQHPSTVCSSIAPDAQHRSTGVLEPVVPSPVGRTPRGVFHPRTPRERAVSALRGSCIPSQGPECPADTEGHKDRFLWAQPQLETVHQVPNMPPLGLLGGIHPALDPVSSRGLEKPGMEKWRGCPK